MALLNLAYLVPIKFSVLGRNLRKLIIFITKSLICVCTILTILPPVVKLVHANNSSNKVAKLWIECYMYLYNISTPPPLFFMTARCADVTVKLQLCNEQLSQVADIMQYIEVRSHVCICVCTCTGAIL